MKKIISLTDFSAASLNATNYAADMALAIHADILLLHVLYVPVTYTEVGPLYTPEELRNEMQGKMKTFAEQLEHKTGSRVNITYEVGVGDLLSELRSTCKKVEPYAVIMGSQGAGATEYSLFGSHSANAMKHLGWPVISVPRGVKFHSIKKIALACDFENVVDLVPVDEIEQLVKDFDAQLHVINTDKTKFHHPEMVYESGVLQAMLQKLGPKYHFIIDKDVDEGIMNFCETNNIDLLVVMPRRYSLIGKLIHKSHTKQLVLHSHVPVMAIHEYH